MNAPGRLLFVAPSAYPLGGVQTWLDYLLPGLQARGWRPVLGLTAGRFHDVERYLAVHPWPDTVAITNPTGSPEGRIRALIDVINQVRPQLVVTVNIPDTYAAIERLRFRRQETPHLVMTNHSVERQYLGDAQAWRHVLDGMIGTNRLTCRLATDWAGLEPAQIHYAPYGVELPTHPLDRPGRGDGTLRIAYSGRLDDSQKRAQDLPAILAGLDRRGIRYCFEIAGGGPYEGTLRSQLTPGVEAGRVRFLGVLDPAELTKRVYDQADVLLVTSFWETGPIVIWEAMARGLPVVTSRYIGAGLEGSLRDDENCLLYPVGDSEAAADQLQRLADPDLRARLANRGQALVAERYTRPRSVEQWDLSLRAVLAQPQRPISRISVPNSPAGRLDHWLGVGGGETIRRLLGLTHQHAEAGSEWPHVNQHNDAQDSDSNFFWPRSFLIDNKSE